MVEESIGNGVAEAIDAQRFQALESLARFLKDAITALRSGPRGLTCQDISTTRRLLLNERVELLQREGQSMGLLGEPDPTNLGLFLPDTDPSKAKYEGTSLRSVRKWVEGMACDEPVLAADVSIEDAWLGGMVYGEKPPTVSLKGSFLTAVKRCEAVRDGLALSEFP